MAPAKPNPYEPPPPPGPVKRGGSSREEVPSIVTPTRPLEKRPDDQLEALEGVESKTAEVLRKHSIFTFVELATTTHEELCVILDRAGHEYDVVSVRTWTHQARLLADGDIVEFMAYVSQLRGSEPPLTR